MQNREGKCNILWWRTSASNITNIYYYVHGLLFFDIHGSMAIKKYYTLFYLQSLCTQIFSKAYMYSNLTSLLQKYTPDSTPLLFINLK